MYNGELSDKLVKEWIYGQSRTKEDFYLYEDKCEDKLHSG